MLHGAKAGVAAGSAPAVAATIPSADPDHRLINGRQSTLPHLHQSLEVRDAEVLVVQERLDGAQGVEEPVLALLEDVLLQACRGRLVGDGAPLYIAHH